MHFAVLAKKYNQNFKEISTTISELWQFKVMGVIQIGKPPGAVLVGASLNEPRLVRSVV